MLKGYYFMYWEGAGDRFGRVIRGPQDGFVLCQFINLRGDLRGVVEDFYKLIPLAELANYERIRFMHERKCVEMTGFNLIK